jgi:hypothetical protein
MPTTIINPGPFRNPVNRTPIATHVTLDRSQSCCCPACSGLACLDRTRFFAGQLLSEADLNNEQSYWLAKSQLHNRYLVGWGVVCGMQVVCGECDGWVTVRSGYAIDPCGNDIIVCEDQNFNVVKAIRDCCSPAKTPGANCQPLRYNPSPNCAGTTQKWCITIEYQEQASRLVTPLTSSTQASCSCGCSNGNGTSKGATSSSSSQSCKTSSTQTQTATTVPAGTCEATRTVEGFQLGVISADDLAAENPTPAPGSLTYNVEQCTAGLLKLVKQAPEFNDNTDPQVAYQKTCSFLTVVTSYFAQSGNVTHCKILDAIGNISVPSGSDVGTYTGIVAEIVKAVAYSFVDCLCYTLLPPCPPNPCDKRLVLACVTVRDGSIVDICHFTGRKQLITLQSLGYWLGPLGLDRFRTEISRLLTLLCCGAGGKLGEFTLSSAVYDKEMMTTAGFSNVAEMHRMAAHYVAQTVGASVVNAVAPGARAVDLRTMIDLPPEMAQMHLKEQGFDKVIVQSVSEDPSWDAEAIASSAQFAPAAVSAGQRITMYTQKNRVVGFDVVDPTTAKIQDLQDQITALQGQLGQWNPDRTKTEASPSAPPAAEK